MLEVCPKISGIKVINSQINIARDLEDSFELRVECRAKIGMPKNKDNKSILLSIEMSIFSTQKDDFKVQLESDVFFEYEQNPEDFNQMIEQECMPLAQNAIFNKVDNILVAMGYKQLRLAEEK